MCKILVALLFFFMANTAVAFNEHYDCKQVVDTSLGVIPGQKKYEATSNTKVKKPITVKITGVNGDEPQLTGQSVSKLFKLSNNSNTMWLVEKTDGGTIVSWTLFEKKGLAGVLLISSKSYDSFGAVNFSTLYECN